MDAISPPTYEELVDLTRRQARQLKEAIGGQPDRGGAGAETHAVPASVLRTWARQGRPSLRGLSELLRGGHGHDGPAVAATSS